MGRLGATIVLFLGALALCHGVPATRQSQPKRQAAVAPAKKVIPAKRVTPAKKVAPAKKVVRVPPAVYVTCKVTNENPPFRAVNCKFVSRLKVPVCGRLACYPPPNSTCQSMRGPGGITNENCSWGVKESCALPFPVYPTRGNEYGFGWKVVQPGPVSVRVQSFQRVGFRSSVCPNT